MHGQKNIKSSFKSPKRFIPSGFPTETRVPPSKRALHTLPMSSSLTDYEIRVIFSINSYIFLLSTMFSPQTSSVFAPT